MFPGSGPDVVCDGGRGNRVLLAPGEGRRDVARPKRVKPLRLVQLALVKILDKFMLDFRSVLVGEYRSESGHLRHAERRAVGLPGQSPREEIRSQQPGKDRACRRSEKSFLANGKAGQRQPDVAIGDDMMVDRIRLGAVRLVLLQQGKAHAVPPVMGEEGEAPEGRRGAHVIVHQAGIVGDRVAPAMSRLIGKSIAGGVEGADIKIPAEFRGQGHEVPAARREAVDQDDGRVARVSHPDIEDLYRAEGGIFPERGFPEKIASRRAPRGGGGGRVCHPSVVIAAGGRGVGGTARETADPGEYLPGHRCFLPEKPAFGRR